MVAREIVGLEEEEDPAAGLVADARALGRRRRPSPSSSRAPATRRRPPPSACRRRDRYPRPARSRAFRVPGDRLVIVGDQQRDGGDAAACRPSAGHGSARQRDARRRCGARRCRRSAANARRRRARTSSDTRLPESAWPTDARPAGSGDVAVRPGRRRRHAGRSRRAPAGLRARLVDNGDHHRHKGDEQEAEIDRRRSAPACAARARRPGRAASPRCRRRTACAMDRHLSGSMGR